MTGALSLADYPFVPVHAACRKCDRRGQYRRSSLVALDGEEVLPDVLAHISPITARSAARVDMLPTNDGH